MGLGVSLLDLPSSRLGAGLAGEADCLRNLLGDTDLALDLNNSCFTNTYIDVIALPTTHFGLSGGLVTTEEALLTSLGPTGSFCLALLANVLPPNPGDLGR